MKITLSRIPTIADEVYELIGIGFDQPKDYARTVWRKAKNVMDVLVTVGVVKPCDLGRGKGKYTSSVQMTMDQLVQRYLLAKYGVVFGIESGFISFNNDESQYGILEDLNCCDISEIAEMIPTWMGYSSPYYNPLASENGVVLYHDGEVLYSRNVKAGEKWLPVKYECKH